MQQDISIIKIYSRGFNEESLTADKEGPIENSGLPPGGRLQASLCNYGPGHIRQLT